MGEVEAARADRGIEEEGCERVEFFGVFGGIELQGAVTGNGFFHVGMTAEIILKTVGHESSLGHDAYVIGAVPADFGQQDGIMGASQQDSVDFGVV